MIFYNTTVDQKRNQQRLSRADSIGALRNQCRLYFATSLHSCNTLGLPVDSVSLSHVGVEAVSRD
jgi:hypothetical protein